jgi:hypothetical protein
VETHVRNVGRLLFYMGIAMGSIALIVLFAHGGYKGLLLLNDPFSQRQDLASIPLSRLLATLAVTFSLAMAVPVAIAGRAILRLKPWARTYGLLVASVNMLLIPIGTAVGVYVLWVLNDEATEYLFHHTPARRH